MKILNRIKKINYEKTTKYWKRKFKMTEIERLTNFNLDLRIQINAMDLLTRFFFILTTFVINFIQITREINKYKKKKQLHPMHELFS